MFFIQQDLPEQFLIISGVHFFPQRAKQRIILQIQRRIAVIEPCVEHRDVAAQRSRLFAVAQLKFQLIDDRIQFLRIQPLCNQLFDRLLHRLFDRIPPLVFRIADAQVTIRLRDAVDDAQIRILGKPLSQDRLLEHGFIGSGQVDGKHDQRHQFFSLGMIADDPAKRHLCALARLLLGTDRIRCRQLTRSHQRLVRDVMRFLQLFIMAEILLIQQCQHGIEVHISRMIVFPVGIQKLRIAQIGDLFRIAAGHKAITALRKQQPVHSHFQLGLHRCESALHLIEDDALIRWPLLAFLQLIMPAFLIERIRRIIDGRLEHRIQIHLYQVHEVLRIAARHRIQRLVRKGHGVEEGVHRAFQQMDERFLHRIVLRSAEHGVFQDVEDAAVIPGNRLERDRKQAILLLVVHPDQLCFVLLMFHAPDARMLFRKLFHGCYGKPMDLISHFHMFIPRFL